MVVVVVGPLSDTLVEAQPLLAELVESAEAAQEPIQVRAVQPEM
jgi:hypothetical protein